MTMTLTAPTVESLLDLLGDPDRDVRRNAAQQLSEMRGENHIDIMRQLLCSPDAVISSLAFETLLEYGEASVDAFLHQLPRCNILVQPQIVQAIAVLGSQKAVTPLMEMLQETSYATLRYVIIETLGKLGDPAAAPLIATYANDPDHHVRSRVQRALEKLNTIH